MREVTPKELQKLNDKSFKNTQKIFRRRLREIAANGNKEADFDKGHFSHEDEIIAWLRSLGFNVTAGTYKYYITWPEEEDICEKLRRECLPILNSALPEAARNAVSRLTFTKENLGDWIFNSHTYDYVCSECGKHSEYTSLYCPNCGKKLKPLEGQKYE